MGWGDEGGGRETEEEGTEEACDDGGSLMWGGRWEEGNIEGERGVRRVEEKEADGSNETKLNDATKEGKYSRNLQDDYEL